MKTALTVISAVLLALPLSAMAGGRGNGHGRGHDRSDNDRRGGGGNGDDYFTCYSVDGNGETYEVASPGNRFALQRFALNACLDSSEVPDTCASVDCTRL